MPTFPKHIKEYFSTGRCDCVIISPQTFVHSTLAKIVKEKLKTKGIQNQKGPYYLRMIFATFLFYFISFKNSQ